ncbi:MAG TPA: DnaJ domain-containing protein [Myxococcota bacterium]|nr:DnaJ domain-containing protein [Myxococcota bacterium]
MQLGGQGSGEARVPQLAPGCDPARLPLSPAEGYLLSRIDGRTPWSLLRQIGGLPPSEVDRCLERWVLEGILVVDGSAPKSNPPPGGAPGKDKREGEDSKAAPHPPLEAAPSAAAASPASVETDESLDLPVEAQERILEFEKRLKRPYHEILGVPATADVKAVKRAYFELSKEYHPDRYFRRNIGPFGPRLERIFKRLVEAYELLSDPATRAEVQRNVAEAPPPAAAAASATEKAPAGPRKKLPPLHLHAPQLRALAERKAKAKGFFETGMAAFKEGRWREAAASVRLAIAFDPWNEAVKEAFGEVQHKANQERAEQLLKEANANLDLRRVAEALPLFEEALLYRPHDPDVNHTTARLAWLAAGDLKKAKEYAVRACELRPEVSTYRRTLGQIYKAAGLIANARRELEAVLRIDPKDAEAKQELRSLPKK